MTALDIIRVAIPNADEALADYILWERTPYPCGAVSARGLYKAASAFRRACDHGIELCDLCHRKLEAGQEYTCGRCSLALYWAGKERS